MQPLEIYHYAKTPIHQATTMLATSKYVLLPGHNHPLTTVWILPERQWEMANKWIGFVADWHLVSVRTFSVTYDWTLFYACKSSDQTSGNTQSGQSVWWLQMAIYVVIFLGGLCEYLWVNILTISPPRMVSMNMILQLLLKLNLENRT